MATMHTPPSGSESHKDKPKEHTGKSSLSSGSLLKKWMAIPVVLLVAIVGVLIVRFSRADSTTYGPSQFTNIPASQVKTKANGTKYWHATGSMDYTKAAAEVRTTYAAGVAVPAEQYCALYGTPPSGTKTVMSTSNRLKDVNGNLSTAITPAAVVNTGTKIKESCSTSGAVSAASNQYGVVRVLSFWVQTGQANLLDFHSKTGVDLTYTYPPIGRPTLQVSGDKFVNASGTPIQLRGVNRAGMEYQCYAAANQVAYISSGNFDVDNPGTKMEYAETVAAALVKWDASGKPSHAINTVRIPLNEECWLGINGAAPNYSGAKYQNFVARLVYNLSAQGMYVVLDNHRSAYGSHKADSQGQAPNADHSIEFWRQVADRFKNYPNLMFDLFTEPNINCYRVSDGGTCPYDILNGADYFKYNDWTWNLYLNGGTYKNTNASCRSNYASNPDPGIRNNPPCDWITDHPERMGETWQVAGTQQLTDAIRAAGSYAPVAIETLGGGSGYFDGIGSHLPKDPKGKTKFGSEQVVASAHSYDFGGFKTGTVANNADYDNNLANGRKAGGTSDWGPAWAVNGRYPFYMGEFGEIMDSTIVTGTNTNGTPIYDYNNDKDYSCVVGGTTTENGKQGNFTKSTMDWLELHKYAYTAWGWDQQEGCHGPSLVRRGDGDKAGGNDNGSPTTYGARVKAILQARQGL